MTATCSLDAHHLQQRLLAEEADAERRGEWVLAGKRGGVVAGPIALNYNADQLDDMDGHANVADNQLDDGDLMVLLERHHQPRCNGYACCLSNGMIMVLNVIQTSFLFGYNIGVLNSCMNGIALNFQWCSNGWDSTCRQSQFRQASINSILFLGAVFGSLWSSRLVCKGRRVALQSACFIFLLGGALGAFTFDSYGFFMLTLSRLLSGVGLGVVTVVTPMYISEMTPPRDRGFYGTMHQTLIAVGIFVSITLGLPLTPNSAEDSTYDLQEFDRMWWRFMIGFQCIPAVLCYLGFEFVCTWDTPHYYVENDKTVEAATTIMLVHGADSITQIEPTLLAINRAVTEAKSLTEISLREAFFEPYYQYGLLLGVFLAALQQLCGVNVIVSSSDALFGMAGLPPSTVTKASTIMALSNAVASSLAALLIENWGRRKLLVTGLSLQVISMAPIGAVRWLEAQRLVTLFSSYQVTLLSVVGTIAFIISFSIALGPVTWIYLSEIYPVEIRGPALGFCGAINWITAFVIVFFGKFLDITDAFLLFGGVCLIGLVCTCLWVVETKGSTMENSPVSPQSLRSGSRLIQQSRGRDGGRQDLTVEGLREKLRSEAGSARGDMLGMSNMAVGNVGWVYREGSEEAGLGNAGRGGAAEDERSCVSDGMGISVEDVGSPQSQYFNYYSERFGKEVLDRGLVERVPPVAEEVATLAAAGTPFLTGNAGAATMSRGGKGRLKESSLIR